MKIYVAGPMTGYPAFNFPAFDEAARTLRDFGHVVCNPAEHDRDEFGSAIEQSATGDPADAAAVGFSLRQALNYDLGWITSEADAVAVLDGWESSKGARAEVATALALGLLVAPVRSIEPDGFASEVITSIPGTQSIAEIKASLDADVRELAKVTETPFDPFERTVSFADVPDVLEGYDTNSAPLRSFDGGATRDSDTGKWDFEGFLSPMVLWEFARYMHKNRQLADGSMRGSDNWQAGIPLDVYMKSLTRHFMDLWMLHRGYKPERPENGEVPTLEDTLGGLMFNLQGYWFEKLRKSSAADEIDRLVKSLGLPART